jgi:hypothetical protein
MGPFTISVSAAVPATNALCDAIYAATRAVDQRSTAELRHQVVQALTDATIPCTPPQGPVLVSRGDDMRGWLSLNLSSVPDAEHKDLAERVATVIARAGLRLTSSAFPEAQDTAERLVAGEPLRVERKGP